MPIMSTILAFIGNGVMGFSKEIYTIQHEDKAPLTLVTAQQRQLAKLFFACSNAGALKSNQRTGAVFVCVGFSPNHLPATIPRPAILWRLSDRASL